MNDKSEETKKPQDKWKLIVVIQALLLAGLIPFAMKYCGSITPAGNNTNIFPTDNQIFNTSGGNNTEKESSSDIKIVANITESTTAANETTMAATTEAASENITEAKTSVSTEHTEAVPAATPAQQETSTAAVPTQPPTTAPTTAPQAADGNYLLTYAAGNSWEAGSIKMCTVEFNLTNQSNSPLENWNLVLNIAGLDSFQGWGGNIAAEGDTVTITNMDYNGNISAGGAITFGGNVGTTGNFKIISATVNGAPCTITSGTVDKNVQNNPNPQNNPNNKPATVDTSSLLKRSASAVQGDDWLHTDGSRIYDKDGKQVWLTGVNWFGYNTGTNTFDGLWASRFEPTVKAIADHGFNLIRVPISAELINQWAAGQYPKANYNNAYNETLNSLNSLEIFDYFLKLAEENGIKVMPDIHSAETNASGHNVNLWCTSKVTVDDYYAALEWMADRYKNNDTIIAFDLKNEPHGKPNEGNNAAIWNNSTAANNWKHVAETAAKKVLAKNPNVLVLVEGIEIYPINKKGDYSSTDSKDYYFNWWGGNLRGVADFPINLGQYQNKLVYSPHDYGPTVYKQPWFDKNYTYASLMKDCWHDNWFYIHENNIAPLLIGEWGGFMTEPNLTWMTYMRQLISTYHLNHTFWCLNANSGDTGGLLLDDFTTWDFAKYDFVKQVLWQENGKFVGLDHAIPLGENGINLSAAKGLK